MALPQLSKERLAEVLTSAPSPSALYDALSHYETDAGLLFTDNEVTGDAELLSVFYSSYLVSLLLINEIPEARMLTHRMPPTLVAKDQTLQNSIALLQAVWQNDHVQVYKVLRELPWPGPLKGIVQAYERSFQEKTFHDISRAYEAIRPETAAAYLGYSGESADTTLTESCTKRGWIWDEEEKLLRPKVLPSEKSKAVPKTNNGLGGVISLLGSYGG
ncbi:hypothetical protein Plec18167_008626 [Paecilomyces lecythidis]|uniref:CSN8/PSMD8/EIF3K domain-containing protein n=1 Tax=Paecilomyces lecythidis TaxID=3004212 RepID=A0ABR3WW10_9EURO